MTSSLAKARADSKTYFPSPDMTRSPSPLGWSKVQARPRKFTIVPDSALKYPVFLNAVIECGPYGIGDALLKHYARYDPNGHGRAGPVGSLKPNDLGLFDMLGNAREWCHDALAPYPVGPAMDVEQPGRVGAEKPRVLRGGSFLSVAPELRAAHRIGCQPQVLFSQAGFRVARTYANTAGR